jgi:hypothetical protein
MVSRINRKKLCLLLLLPMLAPLSLFAQQDDDDNTTKVPVQMAIPPSAKLSLAGSDLGFAVAQGTGNGAQQILSPSTVGEVWINYSSVVEANTTNTIYASLSSDDLPPEVSIKLKIGKDAGAGNGQVGKPADPIILHSFPQPIISNIGSCYTGQGLKKGHQLTYSWDLKANYNPEVLTKEDLANLKVGVIYTIVNEE